MPFLDNSGGICYNVCDVNFPTVKFTVLPYGITPKIKDFRTFLEIQSFVLACKQTDTNFVYYNRIYQIITALSSLSSSAREATS